MCFRTWGRAVEYAVSVLILVASFGCSTRQAQSTVQESLTELAHGLDAANESAAKRLRDAPEKARNFVLNERLRDPELSVDRAMEMYREQLDSWYSLSLALSEAHHSLLLAQRALDLWVSTGRLPDIWGEHCDSIGASFEEVMAALEVLCIDAPTMLQQAVPYAATICEVASAFFVQQE